MPSSASKSAAHWDATYDGGDRARSWYQPHAETSLELIHRGEAPQAGDALAGVVDVGGGASTLVDDLLAAGYTDVTVLDVSRTGLEIARQRLGQRGSAPTWIVADLLDWRPDRTFDVWHDRAVLHFLTDAQDRIRYRSTILAATHPGSRVAIGVFGPQGPSSCSGLPVNRFNPTDVAQLLGDEFTMTDAVLRVHTTPTGAAQQFLWVSAVRR